MAEGLDGRSRDENGQTRAKRGDTKVETLRGTYGQEFAPGIRGDAHLDTVLQRSNQPSLSQYLKSQPKRGKS